LFTEYVSNLPEDRLEKLTLQMVGATHHTALLAMNRIYAQEDRTEYDLWLEFEGQEFSERYKFPSGVITDGSQKLNKRKLLTRLVKELTPIVGGTVIHSTASEFSMSTLLPDLPSGMSMGLWVRHISGHETVEYAQSLSIPNRDGPNYGQNPNQFTSNLFRLYGLGLMEYPALKESDADPIVASLRVVCDHYVKNIPDLLRELPAPD